MAILEEADEKKIENKFKPIDINDTSLPEGEAVEFNADADAWEQAAPPPDGVYLCKVLLAKQGFEQGKIDDTGEIFYRVNLALKIQDNEKWADRTIFYRLSTYISAGREISTVLGFIRKTGVEVKDAKITPLAQMKLLKKILIKEPKLYFKGEWKAWDKATEDWAKSGMKNFPKSEDGKTYNHIIKVSKGATAVAGFKVDRCYGLKEYRAQMEREAALKKQQQSTQPKTNSSAASASGDGDFKPVTNASIDEQDFVLDE
jgi:hypothetical protein